MVEFVEVEAFRTANIMHFRPLPTENWEKTVCRQQGALLCKLTPIFYFIQLNERPESLKTTTTTILVARLKGQSEQAKSYKK
jgi:hypothetical protein